MADAKGTIIIEAEVDDLRRELDALEKKFDSFSKESARDVGRIDKALEEVGRQSKRTGKALQSLGSILSAVAFKKIATDITDTARAFDSLNRRLDPAQIEFVRKEADRLGFSFLELGDTFQKFEITGLRAGENVDILRDVFSKTAEAVRSFDGNTEQLNSSLRAVEQIITKTKVGAEELIQQLAEALPGSLQAIARGFGLTTKRMLEFSAEGKIQVKDLLPALAKGFDEAFGPDVVRNLDSANAEFARTSNALDVIKASIGEGFLDELVRGMELARTESGKLNQGFKDIGQGIGVLITFAGRLGQTIGGAVTVAFGAAAEAGLFLTGALVGLAESLARLVGLTDFANKLKETESNLAEFADVAAEFAANGADDFKAGLDGMKGSVEGLGGSLKDAGEEMDDAGKKVKELSDATVEAAAIVVAKFQAMKLEATEFGEAVDKSIGGIQKQLEKLRAGFDETAKASGKVSDSQSEAAETAKELEAEQKALQKQTFLSVKDMNRLDVITRELSDAQHEASKGFGEFTKAAKSAGQAAKEQGRLQQVAKGLIDETSNSVAALKDKYGDLSASAVNDLQLLNRGLQNSADLGTLTAGELELFGLRSQQAFEKARVESANLVDSQKDLAQATGKAGKASKDHGFILDESGKKIAQFGEETNKATRDLEAYDEEVGFVAASQEELNKRVEEFGPLRTFKDASEEVEELNKLLMDTNGLLKQIETVSRAIDAI